MSPCSRTLVHPPTCSSSKCCFSIRPIGPAIRVCNLSTINQQEVQEWLAALGYQQIHCLTDVHALGRDGFNLRSLLVMFTWFLNKLCYKAIQNRSNFCSKHHCNIETGSLILSLPCLRCPRAPQAARIPGPHPHPSRTNSFRTFKSKL